MEIFYVLTPEGAPEFYNLCHTVCSHSTDIQVLKQLSKLLFLSLITIKEDILLLIHLFKEVNTKIRNLEIYKIYTMLSKSKKETNNLKKKRCWCSKITDTRATNTLASHLGRLGIITVFQ